MEKKLKVVTYLVNTYSNLLATKYSNSIANHISTYLSFDIEEKDKFNKGKKKRKCRKKTAEEIALELPSVPSDKNQLKIFCKTNLYNSNCKKYYDMKLNAIKNPKNIQVKSVSEADELKKFADLKEKGIITEEEFNKKKKEILGL